MGSLIRPASRSAAAPLLVSEQVQSNNGRYTVIGQQVNMQNSAHVIVQVVIGGIGSYAQRAGRQVSEHAQRVQRQASEQLDRVRQMSRRDLYIALGVITVSAVAAAAIAPAIPAALAAGGAASIAVPAAEGAALAVHASGLTALAVLSRNNGNQALANANNDENQNALHERSD